MAQKTGKISPKPYKCREFGHQEMRSTNHYGTIYIRCGKCSKKTALSPIKVFDCLEPVPEGWEKPEEWKMTTLGEVADIVNGM